tara:strand:- start:1271 stop:1483 length:213 start_codon:yes stop_codon:yes gene_type:complete
MQKIFNIIAVASGVLTLTIIGAGIYGYRYVTSDNFEKLIKNKIMGDIQNVLPKAIENELPSKTGLSIPFK